MLSKLLSTGILLPTLISATTLYLSSYGGNITSLSIAPNPSGSNFTLTKTGSYPQCGPNPSWLTIDSNRGLLFCLNEGLSSPNGSLASFTINPDGSLNPIQNTTTISGPVNGVIYGQSARHRAIALSHYTGSAVSTWSLDGNGAFSPLENFTFPLPTTLTPNPARQDSPHPHQAILDPTGTYILIPDLGSDLIRIFSIDSSTLHLTPLTPFAVPSGSGPRHAVFATPSSITTANPPPNSTYLYLVSELSGTITTYSITYLPSNSGLNFTRLAITSTLGPNLQPPGTAPAEILLSPGGDYLYVSNRNTSNMITPSPLEGTDYSTYSPQYSFASVNGSLSIPAAEVGDSISTFAINPTTNIPTFLSQSSAGGVWPRNMALSPDGSLLAVGLQYDKHAVVYAVDSTSGVVGAGTGQGLAAAVGMSGSSEANVTCIVWGK